MKSLALLLLILTTNLFAENCGSFWAIGFPDPSRIHDVINCEQGVTSTPFGTEIYYTNELLISPGNPQLTDKLNLVSESLSLSYSIYRTLGDMPRIKVIFYDRSYYGDSGGETTYAFAFINFFRPETEACPILVYPEAFSFNEEKLKQVIAHEVFHCFQIKNYRAQTQWAIHNSENVWWLEGSAQFFSNLVYPRANLEYDSMFGRYTGIEAVTQQPRPYSTAIFFQSLYNTTGRNAHYILGFYNQMPSAAGASQEAAVNSVGDIDEHFHKFARDFYTHEITDSGGTMAPVTRLDPSTINVTLEDDQHYDVINKAFAIMPYKLIFPHRGRYRVSMSSGGGTGNYKFSIRKNGSPRGTAWSELPYTFYSSCSTNEEYDLIVTRLGTASDIDSVNLQVTREEREDCGCEITTRPTHACLFGNWILDHASMRAFFERMFSANRNIFFEESSGDYLVTFLPTGEVIWTQNNLTVKSRMEIRTSRRTINSYYTQVTNGVNSGIYTNMGRGRMCGQDRTIGMSCVLTVETEGRTTSGACRMPMTIPNTESTYECHGDTLIHKAVVGANPDGSDLIFNYVFNRVR